MNRRSFPTFRWIAVVLLAATQLLRGDCNCSPDNKIRVSMAHGFTPASAVVLWVDGVACPAGFKDVQMKLDDPNPHTVKVVADPAETTLPCELNVYISLPHCDMEATVVDPASPGTEYWYKTKMVKIIVMKYPSGDIEYQPASYKFRLTKPKSDDTTTSPDPGTESNMESAPPSAEPDPVTGVLAIQPGGANIHIPLGSAPTADGMNRSAGTLGNYGPATSSFTAPSSFQFDAIPEVTAGGASAPVKTVNVLDGSGNITEKHFIAPAAVLRLRGWNSSTSSAVSYTGATEALVEVYEPSQYNATTKVFTGSPHSYYRLETATGNGLLPGVTLVQSNRGHVLTQKMQVSSNGYTSRREEGSTVTVSAIVAIATDTWSVETAVTRDGIVVSKKTEDFGLISGQKVLLAEILDPVPASSGDELATYYSYYTDGRLRSVWRPDDSWNFYTYSSNVTTEYGPWLSDSFLAYSGGVYSLPTSGTGVVRVSSHDEDGNSSEQTYLKDFAVSGFGVMMSQSSTSVAIGSTYKFIESSQNRDGSNALESYRLEYPDTAASGWLAGRTVMTWDLTGKATLHSYEKGTWASGSFTVGSGDYVRHTSSIGYISSPSSSSLPANFTNVASHSSRSVTITGPDGVVRDEDYYCGSSGSYGLAVARDHEYESSGFHRPTGIKIGSIYISKTEYTSAVVTRNWDDEGTMTETEVNDRGELVRTTTSGNTEVPAVTTTTSRVGNIITTALDGNMVSIEGFDAAARLISRQASSGAFSTIVWSDGGRTSTETGPGGVSTIKTRYLDGHAISMTGTSGIPRYWTYAVDGTTGLVTTSIALGTSGGARYTSSASNWDGSIAVTTSPNPTGSGPAVTSTRGYDSISDTLLSVTSSATNTARQIRTAPSGSAAAALGHYYLSGSEADGDGAEISSGDRIVETSIAYGNSGGTWSAITTRNTFHTDNSSDCYTTSDTEYLTPESVTDGSLGNGLRWTTVASFNGGDSIRKEHNTYFSSAAVVETENLLLAEATVSPEKSSTFRHGKLISSASHGTLAPETTAYDASARVLRRVSSTGAVTNYSYNTAGQLIQTRDHENQPTNYTYYGPTHASAGRVWTVTNPAGEVTETIYNTRGQTTETTGTGTYRVTWGYNTWGEISEMRTYRSGTTGDLTQWTRDPATGVLKEKIDAAGKKILYTYDAAGRLATRSFARLVSGVAVSTTYGYNAYGDVTSKNYSDTTVDVAITPDRLGRPTQIVDASGTRTMTYQSVYGYMSSVTYGSTGPLASRVLSISRDSRGLTGYDIDSGAAMATIGYDSEGRVRSVKDSTTLPSVGANDSSHFLTYQSGTNLLNSVESRYGSSSSVVMTRNQYRDRLQRIFGVETKNASGAVLSRHGYTLDAAGRRIKATRENGQAWDYGYNSRGEVTSGTKSFPDGSAMPGHAFAYTYDGIGNRSTATHGGTNTGVTYTTNSLNQYSNIATERGRFITGEALVAEEVRGSFAGSGIIVADRPGGLGFFSIPFTEDTSAGPKWTLQAVASYPSLKTRTGYTWTPAPTFAPTYDDDGNLKDDGRWVYTWDAENRLTLMTNNSTAGGLSGMPNQQIEFVYDSEGRMVSRTVKTSGSYAAGSSQRFLYLGWNVVAEYSANSPSTTTMTLDATHLWGPDLSGSFGGAGGVGGLLSTRLRVDNLTCFPCYDGNGNITAWSDSSGALLGRREYSPFGQLIAMYNFTATGSTTLSKLKYGFSTKYTDPTSGLLYYGYRHYDPVAGRWLNKDPIEEPGGLNLFSFLGNDGVDRADYLGGMPIGQKLIAIYGARAVLGTAGGPTGGSINSLKKWYPIEDDDKEMNPLTPGLRYFKYEQWVCSRARRGGLSPSWKFFPTVTLVETDPLVNRVGMGTLTAWTLNKTHLTQAWGSIEAKCDISEPGKYCFRNRRFLWQWDDEMDANSFPTASIPEGLTDIVFDDPPVDANFKFTIKWNDENQEERCFFCK